MKVNPIGLPKIESLGVQEKTQKTPNAQEVVNSFQELLSQALNQVNSLQNNADEMMKKLAAGEIKDLHQVMIAVEEAGVALQLTLQIRNRIIESYQEIMRMQI